MKRNIVISSALAMGILVLGSSSIVFAAEELETTPLHNTSSNNMTYSDLLYQPNYNPGETYDPWEAAYYVQEEGEDNPPNDEQGNEGDADIEVQNTDGVPYAESYEAGWQYKGTDYNVGENQDTQVFYSYGGAIRWAFYEVGAYGMVSFELWEDDGANDEHLGDFTATDGDGDGLIKSYEMNMGDECDGENDAAEFYLHIDNISGAETVDVSMYD